MNNKKRYAVGIYVESERENDPEWMKSKCNRLVAFIYDNIDMFNIRYTCASEDKDRTWIVLDTKELLKAKDAFSNEETTEVNDFIDICLDYDKWQTACVCCDTITLNAIPYTYRGQESIGREYNCLMCSGLTDRYANKVEHKFHTEGMEKAIDLLIDICEDRYNDPIDNYICHNCDNDLRSCGIVYNNNVYYKEYEIQDGDVVFDNENNPLYKEGLIVSSIDEYNKGAIVEEEFNYYPINVKLKESKQYHCANCCAVVANDIAKEIIGG